MNIVERLRAYGPTVIRLFTPKELYIGPHDYEALADLVEAADIATVVYSDPQASPRQYRDAMINLATALAKLKEAQDA